MKTFIPVVIVAMVCVVLAVYITTQKSESAKPEEVAKPAEAAKPVATDKPTCLVIDLNQAYSDTQEGKDIMANIAHKYDPIVLGIKNRMEQATKDKSPKLQQMRAEVSQELSGYKQEIEKIRYDAYNRFLDRSAIIVEGLNTDKIPVFLSTALFNKQYCTDLTPKLTEAYNKAVQPK